MSTAPVARDIVEIFERHGEWREAEARRLVHSQGVRTSANEAADTFDRTMYKHGEEMVQYWGFVSSEPPLQSTRSTD